MAWRWVRGLHRFTCTRDMREGLGGERGRREERRGREREREGRGVGREERGKQKRRDVERVGRICMHDDYFYFLTITVVLCCWWMYHSRWVLYPSV